MQSNIQLKINSKMITLFSSSRKTPLPYNKGLWSTLAVFQNSWLILHLALLPALPGRNCWVSLKELGRWQGRLCSNPLCPWSASGTRQENLPCWQQHGRAVLWVTPVICDIPTGTQCVGKLGEREELLCWTPEQRLCSVTQIILITNVSCIRAFSLR